MYNDVFSGSSQLSGASLIKGNGIVAVGEIVNGVTVVSREYVMWSKEDGDVSEKTVNLELSAAHRNYEFISSPYSLIVDNKISYRDIFDRTNYYAWSISGVSGSIGIEDYGSVQLATSKVFEVTPAGSNEQAELGDFSTDDFHAQFLFSSDVFSADGRFIELHFRKKASDSLYNLNIERVATNSRRINLKKTTPTGTTTYATYNDGGGYFLGVIFKTIVDVYAKGGDFFVTLGSVAGTSFGGILPEYCDYRGESSVLYYSENVGSISGGGYGYDDDITDGVAYNGRVVLNGTKHITYFKNFYINKLTPSKTDKDLMREIVSKSSGEDVLLGEPIGLTECTQSSGSSWYVPEENVIAVSPISGVQLDTLRLPYATDRDFIVECDIKPVPHIGIGIGVIGYSSFDTTGTSWLYTLNVLGSTTTTSYGISNGINIQYGLSVYTRNFTGRNFQVTANEWHRLRMECVDRYLTYYIDGQLFETMDMYNAKDIQLVRGVAPVLTAKISSSADMAAQFRNVTFTEASFDYEENGVEKGSKRTSNGLEAIGRDYVIDKNQSGNISIYEIGSSRGSCTIYAKDILSIRQSSLLSNTYRSASASNKFTRQHLITSQPVYRNITSKELVSDDQLATNKLDTDYLLKRQIGHENKEALFYDIELSNADPSLQIGDYITLSGVSHSDFSGDTLEVVSISKNYSTEGSGIMTLKLAYRQ